jgi:uncharacterized membrane protein
LVNFDKLNYADLLIGFRQLMPMQQAAVAGLVVLVVYIPYAYFLLHLNIVESISMSIYSAILFMVVFYFTSVIIRRKNQQLANQSLGPKKGLRNK